VNLRIWAAQAVEPTILFNVAPPEADKRWNWFLSQDGRYAIAVSIQADSIGRRATGLYDLTAAQWLWKNALPWPDSHESPYVFDRHTVLRYSKNAKHFAMEIDAEGHITAIDTLGKTTIPAVQTIPADAAFPGTPVAVKSGVFFVEDAQHQNLIGYAQERLPGLRYAGKGDENTLFSGNGLMKLTIRNGRVTVSDSLTQTVLQQIEAWPHATNTSVTGSLTTYDGSQLSVFLKTDFGGTSTMTREWSVALALYTGTVLQSFNADALLAKPQRVTQRTALSPDGAWQVSVAASNDLVFTSQAQKRVVVRVDLARAIGLQKPLDHIAFLEEGRSIVLRQGENFWLLDFAVARGYADLLARQAANADAPPAASTAPETSPSPSGQPPSSSTNAANAALPSVAALSPSPSFMAYNDCLKVREPATLALQAEWLIDNQAWGYAAALLDEAHSLQRFDARAPRVNPLLLARCHILAGQTRKARAVCREALGQLVAAPSSNNRMIRYHLQGLFFSQP